MSNISENKIFCPACSKELRCTDKFRPSCGELVIKNENLGSKKNYNLSKRKTGASKNHNTRKHDELTSKVEKESKTKIISPIKIIYLLVALISASIVINYFAGVFERPVKASSI